MARIEKRANGSYRIQVSCGYSADGTKHHTQSMTWKPPKPGMTTKQVERAVNKAAFEFEEACRSGQTVNACKFETFAEEWFVNVAARTMKPNVVKLSHSYTPRIYERLGHLRLDRITPREIDSFIVWLQKQPIRSKPTATFKGDLKQILKSAGLTQKQFAQKAGTSEQTIKAVIDGKKIMAANAGKIAAALGKSCNECFNSEKNEKMLSPKTVKNYVSLISSVFDYAVHVRAIKENPCRNALLPKIPQKDLKMFSIEEAKRFLDILDSEETPLKYRAFFHLALFGGFRRGEILGLEWDDINFESGIIHIRRTVHYSKDMGYYDTEPKSKSSVRALTLPDLVIFSLKQLQNEQLSQRLKLGDQWHNTNRLFTTWNGHQLSGSGLFTWLTKTCERYELPKVNLHSFRHLNASLLISQGVDVKTVQSVLGHSQASTTLDIYAAAFREREAQALGAVANVLTESRKQKQA